MRVLLKIYYLFYSKTSLLSSQSLMEKNHGVSLSELVKICWPTRRKYNLMKVAHMCAQSLQCVRLFVTLWTIAHQDPLSMGFSRQEYWSGLPCLPPRDLPQESNRHLLRLLNWQVGSLPLMSPGKPFSNNRYHLMSRWYISDAVLNILLLIFTTFNGRYYESHLTDWETKA